MKYTNPNIKDHASLGGRKRAERLGQQRRKEIAKLAAQARWAKSKHVCSDICKCVCGFKKYQHTKYKTFECNEYQCRSKH